MIIEDSQVITLAVETTLVSNSISDCEKGFCKIDTSINYRLYLFTHALPLGNINDLSLKAAKVFFFFF